jgi:hypothetical protein
MEVSSQCHAPAALPPGEKPGTHLDRRLGGHQSRSGRAGEENNYQPPPGIEPRSSDSPARILVAIPTELSSSCAKEKRKCKVVPVLN